MSELEERVKRVKKQVGDDCLKILEQEGINTDAAIERVLSEQILKENALQERREGGPIDGNVALDCLTSELIFLMNENDDFEKELKRRFDLLGLSKKQSADLIKKEKQILTTLERPRKRWAGHYFLIEGVKKEDLPSPQELTLSELILIVDDANAAWVRDHEWLCEETFAAVSYVIGNKKEGSPYHNEFLSRLKTLDFTEDQAGPPNQVGSFIRNECMILERLKWGHHSNPAWQKSTMISQ